MSLLGDLIYNDGIVETTRSVLNDLISNLSTGAVNIMALAGSVVKTDYVQNTVIYCQAVALTMLSVTVMFDILMKQQLQAYGEGDDDMGKLFIRLAISVGVISSISYITIGGFEFGNVLAREIAQVDAITMDQLGPIGKIDLIANSPLTILLAWLVAVLVYVLIIFQSMVRGVELSALNVAGPFMAISLANKEHERWSTWWQELLTITMSQALQIFLIKGAIAAPAEYSNWLPVYAQLGGILSSLVWLYVAYKGPNYLRQWMYSSGISKTGGGMINMLIMRRMYTPR